MPAPNWDRAYRALEIIRESEGIDLHALTKELGSRNIGDVRATLTMLGNNGILLSEDSKGGLYIFGKYGVQDRRETNELHNRQ